MLLTVKDVQSLLKVSRQTAYELVNRKDFPKIRLGRAIRVPKAQLEKWIEQNLQK